MSTLAYHEISEAGQRILNPFEDRQLLAVGAAVGLCDGDRILDLACGKGELLCRYAQEYGTRGHGVDISEVFLTAAVARASELDVADRVTFERGDAGAYRATHGAYDVACCIGATWIGATDDTHGLVGTVALLRPAVPPGGLLLIGEPYWHEPPPDEAYEALGVAPDEFRTLAGTLDRFEEANVELINMVHADLASWDSYEALQWWAVDAWLANNVGDTRAADIRATRDRARRNYLTYGRRYLGWGVFVLRT